MVFSNNPTPGDGQNDTSSFDFGLGSAAASDKSLDAAPPFTSRRDARAAAPRELRASKRTIVRASQKRSRKTAPAAFVRSAESAYPADRLLVVVRPPKKKIQHKKGSGILTVLAVVGLFGSVALPAAALAPKVGDTADTAVVEAAAGDAALSVSKEVASVTAVRGEFSATTATDLHSQRSTAAKAKNYEDYFLSGAREAGDDYPWFSELSNNQGGQLSPLNYFYRECVDFVAWRLNRDAGSTSAPFKYVWSDLTPSGGNGSQWKYAWKAHGWPTSAIPIVGSVAYFGSENHVAYVKAVNADGTVLLEEYNWQSDHLYGQRTIASSDVELFLYPPPR